MSDESRRTPLIDGGAPWRAVRGALVAAQKSNRNAPAYSRWINRPLGRVFAASAYKLGLSPNAISLISAAFTFAGIALIAAGTPSVALGLVVCAMLVVGYALDSADGQVARLQGGGSLAGEWLDHVLDAFKNTAFHLAVTVLWLRNPDGWPAWTLAVPLVFTLQASAWFFTMILTDLLLRNAGAKRQALAIEEGRQPIWTSLVGIPADYGFLCLVMVLLGWYPAWRWVYALLAVANVAILALQLVRWYRRLSALR